MSKETFNFNQKEFYKKISELENISEDTLGFQFTKEEWEFLKMRIKQQSLGLKLEFQEFDSQRIKRNYIALEEDDNLSINKNNENKNHLLIEGDNYEVLRALIPTNTKADIIYIDPPYNTGNGDFTYNDNYSNNVDVAVNSDNPHKHSYWLSFMKRRLILAKELLSEDGVIFVSIDNNEQAYLKVLMDEIFGENNFIETLIWQKKSSGAGSDSIYFRTLNEYIHVYAKNKNQVNINKKIADIEDGSYKFSDDHITSRGKYKLNQLDRASLTWSKGLDYLIEHEGIQYIPGNDIEKFVQRENGVHAEKDWQWRWNKEKVDWGIKNDFLVFDKNKKKIYFKQYQYVDNSNNEIQRENPYGNLIFDSRCFGSNGTDEINKIFNRKVFDHPKPVSLIKFIISLLDKEDVTVLDFFAGSGTTAQAVMELNQEDGQKRRFILATNNEFHGEIQTEQPERGIAQAITRERIYRVINGEASEQFKKHNPDIKDYLFKWKYSDEVPYLNNNSVSYLKVLLIDKIDGEYEMLVKDLYAREFENKNIKMIDLEF